MVEALEIPATTKAWIQTCKGPPSKALLLTTISTPQLKTETSVLVKISHASLHPGTSILMHTIPMSFRTKPVVCETDFAGTIVAVGPKVITSPGDSSLQIGTLVFGSIPVSAHFKGAGALAGYVAIEAADVTPIPKGLSLEEAAALPVSGITAMDVVDAAGLKPGQKVLVNGVMGGIGHMAVQLVRQAIGPEGWIVGVCSTKNAQRAKNYGCNEVLDYAISPGEKDLIETLSDKFTTENELDAVVDCYGSQELWYGSPKFLKQGADHPYATVGPKLQTYSVFGLMSMVAVMAGNALTPVWVGGVNRKYSQVASFINPEKLERLRNLARDGIIKVLPGHKFSWSQVPQAYDVLLSGHAVGKIIISIEE